MLQPHTCDLPGLELPGSTVMCNSSRHGQRITLQPFHLEEMPTHDSAPEAVQCAVFNGNKHLQILGDAKDTIEDSHFVGVDPRAEAARSFCTEAHDSLMYFYA